MTSEHILNHARLGSIYIHANARARRMTFRCQKGHLTCTVPPHTTLADIAKAVEKMEERLEALLKRGKESDNRKCFTPDTRIEADGFRFHSEMIAGAKPGVREDAQGLTFRYPPETDWTSEHLQEWLTNTVTECLRRRARHILLPRLNELAMQRGLHYRSAAIRKTYSRWGSCSSNGDIHLSLYLMLLPAHLRDYIMHHELTHLLEMNHGTRFHALLNQAVDGKSEALRREVKQQRIPFMER